MPQDPLSVVRDVCAGFGRRDVAIILVFREIADSARIAEGYRG